VISLFDFFHLLSIPSGRPRRRNEPRGIKDVVYVALVGNGTVSPLYVETPHGADLRGTDHFLRVIPPMKGKKKDGVGRGEIGMLDWVAEQVQSGFLVPGDLVLVDAEPALSTEGVVFALSSAGVEIDVFPPILGKFMDPCDEYFNSVFKRAYYKSVHLDIANAKERKYELMRQAYFGVPEEAVLHFFHHCGLIGNEDPESVMDRLLSEGAKIDEEYWKFHCEQIEAYESWCWRNGRDLTK